MNKYVVGCIHLGDDDVTDMLDCKDIVEAPTMENAVRQWEERRTTSGVAVACMEDGVVTVLRPELCTYADTQRLLGTVQVSGYSVVPVPAGPERQMQVWGYVIQDTEGTVSDTMPGHAKEDATALCGFYNSPEGGSHGCKVVELYEAPVMVAKGDKA